MSSSKRTKNPRSPKTPPASKPKASKAEAVKVKAPKAEAPKAKARKAEAAKVKAAKVKARKAEAAKVKAPSSARAKSLAATSDRHDLYERAVQDPETDVRTMTRIFQRFRPHKPLSLREDFCGTAYLATEWVRSHAGRTAVGVDLDGPTLTWGKERHVAALRPEQAARVTLIEGDVLDGAGPKSDIVCALNFSYSLFKEREQLLRYFQVARDRLVDDGLFMLDIWGGSETLGEHIQDRELDGFTYRWEKASFDPLTHEGTCYIHFLFPDGSRREKAFAYDWRVWTAPELRDLLIDAGFSRIHFLWEHTDADGEGTGSFYKPKRVEQSESWWTYLVAER